MSLFTFRRDSGDGLTVYLCRYGDGPLAETRELGRARLFCDTAEFRAWYADLEPGGPWLFDSRRWTRTDLQIYAISPGAVEAARNPVEEHPR